MRAVVLPLVILAVAAVVAWVFWPEPAPDVVLYCGVDQDQSRGITDEYEKKTGQEVKFVPENERNRSIGLPQQLLQERSHPRADVYWSNENMHIVDLGLRGLLAPLPPGLAERFPPEWRDPKGLYVAFGARARVLLVNTKLLPDPKDRPTSVDDLLNPKYKAMGFQTAMAEPFVGTTFTHAVVILTRDEAKGKAFFEGVVAAMDDGLLRLTPGNGEAMQLARDSEKKVAFCLTDTDDAWGAVQQGFPVEIVYPDQGEGQVGTVVMANTAALVRGGPNPENAARLLEHIASPGVELELANGPSAQMPLRTENQDVKLPEHVKRPGKDFRMAKVDWAQVGANRDRWTDWLNHVFRK